MGDPSKKIQIKGTVEPGFESIRALYTKNMHSLVEKETQLCIYHEGKKVVDLWASVEDNPHFSADSIINVFSSGKTLETIAMASLVSKGLLSYESKIVQYWPEFGANGKQDVTIAELMRHEAGLATFDCSIDPENLLPANIKQNKIGRIIESHAQKFRANGASKREYHAVTRGWIANEIFRRVDPKGRTIGEYIREDISEPLNINVLIGVKEFELNQRVKVSPLSIRFQLLEGLKPKALGRKMELNIIQMISKVVRLLLKARNSTTKGAPPPYTGMKGIRFFNKESVAMGESPSSNANCSARGLATIAAMMSARGKWAGKEYINERAWDSMHDQPSIAQMGIGFNAFTQGGLAKFYSSAKKDCAFTWALNAGREGFYGWTGLGGSIFQWHPEHQIGFAYIPTSLNVLDIFNERGKAYQVEAIICAEKLKS